MRIQQFVITAVAVAVFAFAGCSKSGVDTSKLENSFKSAEPAAQTSVEKAVTAIKSADYAGAMTELKSLAEKAQLTPEQQQAIKDVVSQLQQMLADTVKKAGEDASKAAGDLQKSLKK